MYSVNSHEEEKAASHSQRVVYLTDSSFDGMQDVRTVHSHRDTVEIALVVSGRGKTYIEGREYNTKEGDILVYNTNLLHQDQAVEGGYLRFMLLGIRDLKLPGKVPGKLCDDSRHFCLDSGKYYGFLKSGFSLARDALREQRTFAGDLAESFGSSLIDIILQIIEDLKKTDDHNSDLKLDKKELAEEMRSYIDQNYSRNFTLDDLAERFHINRYYASHVFSKSFGRSPMSYRTYRRIGEAQTLLTCSDETISRIASIVGFSSPGRFGQVFMSIVGMSPKNYRNKSLETERTLL